MEITDQQLRERYRAKQVDELAALRHRGDLTDQAARVLDEVLAERGVAAEEITLAAEEYRREVVGEGAKASLADRFGAQFVDGLIACGACVLVLLVGGAIGGSSFVLPLGGLILIGYLWLSDALPGGQSLGKRFFRIAVVDAVTGKPCTLIQSFARNALLSVFGILDVLFIFGRERRRLGDHLARTTVVKVGAKGLARADAVS